MEIRIVEARVLYPTMNVGDWIITQTALWIDLIVLLCLAVVTETAVNLLLLVQRLAGAIESIAERCEYVGWAMKHTERGARGPIQLGEVRGSPWA